MLSAANRRGPHRETAVGQRELERGHDDLPIVIPHQSHGEASLHNTRHVVVTGDCLDLRHYRQGREPVTLDPFRH